MGCSSCIHGNVNIEDQVEKKELYIPERSRLWHKRLHLLLLLLLHHEVLLLAHELLLLLLGHLSRLSLSLQLLLLCEPLLLLAQVLGLAEPNLSEHRTDKDSRREKQAYLHCLLLRLLLVWIKRCKLGLDCSKLRLKPCLELWYGIRVHEQVLVSQPANVAVQFVVEEQQGRTRRTSHSAGHRIMDHCLERPWPSSPLPPY